MANATAQLEANDMLNFIKGTAPTVITTLYVALYTTTPTANDGTGGVEVSGSSYARQAVTDAQWSSITQSADTLHQQINATIAVTFPAVTGSPYTVVGVGLYDAVTAGNLREYAAITSQAISVGNAATFPVGNLVIKK